MYKDLSLIPSTYLLLYNSGGQKSTQLYLGYNEGISKALFLLEALGTI